MLRSERAFLAAEAVAVVYGGYRMLTPTTKSGCDAQRDPLDLAQAGFVAKDNQLDPRFFGTIAES